MQQPEGFVSKGNETKVCLLKKALYGLKQSSRVWHQKVESELNKLGYCKSKHDPCIFTKMSNKSFNAVALHVDDFLLFSNDVNEKAALKKHLKSRFSIKDLGEAKCCLGLNIERSQGQIKINQQPFVTELLKKFNMQDSKPVSTPMETNFKLKNEINSNENRP